MKKVKLENLRYNSQLDNSIDPHATCFVSSVAMTIRTLEQKSWGGQNRKKYTSPKFEEELLHDLDKNLSAYKKIAYKIVKQKWVFKYRPRNIYAFWEWYIKEKIPGHTAKYMHLSQSQIKNQLAARETPIIVGTKLTHSGHVVVLVGCDNSGFYVNDPYGDYTKGYPNAKGKECYYLNEHMPKSMNCLLVNRQEKAKNV